MPPMTADPLLVRDIVREGCLRYGTGMKHGDMVMSTEQWTTIVSFVVDELQERGMMVEKPS